MPGDSQAPPAAREGAEEPLPPLVGMRVLRSGFQAHLPKPVDPAALISTVNNLVGTAAPTES